MARQTNIRRRGNAFVVNIRVNGEKVWRSFSTRDAAEVFIEQIRSERRAGTYRAPVKATFEQTAEAWHEHGVLEGGRHGPWKATTRRDYRSVLDAHLLPAFGHLQLAEVNSARIESWRRQQMQVGRLPRRTAQKVLAVLHGIFERARRDYAFPTNPVDEVDRIASDQAGPIDFYAPEEVWALVRAAESEQDGVLFIAAAFTGLRRGELVALRVRACRLRQEHDPRRGELLGRRALDPEVRKAPSGPDGPRGRGYLDGSALRRRYRAAQRRAGLRALRFHDLRHTFASLAVNRVDFVKLQAWMGHADVKTTMRYLHHKSHADDAQLLDGAFEPTTAAGVLQAADLIAVPVSA